MDETTALKLTITPSHPTTIHIEYVISEHVRENDQRTRKPVAQRSIGYQVICPNQTLIDLPSLQTGVKSMPADFLST
jgi:hypothetical protein